MGSVELLLKPILIHKTCFGRLKPIFKTKIGVGDGNWVYQPMNYDSITVQYRFFGHIAKMVKSLVSYQIIDFLESHNFISMDQSAYLKGTQHKHVFVV